MTPDTTDLTTPTAEGLAAGPDAPGSSLANPRRTRL